MAKNEANAKQALDAGFLLLESVLRSSSNLSSKNIGTYSKK